MKTLILTATLLLASCVADGAKKETLLPAMQMAWPHVQFDYEYGILDGLEEEEITAIEWEILVAQGESMGAALGLDGVDWPILPPIESIPWLDMAPWAVRGIQAQLNDGELGANGAMLVVQRLHNFTSALQIMVGDNMELMEVNGEPFWVPMCVRKANIPHPRHLSVDIEGGL